MKIYLPRLILPFVVFGLLIIHQVGWLVNEMGWCECIFSPGQLPYNASLLLGTHSRDWTYFYTFLTGSWIHGDWQHLLGNLSSLLGLTLLFVLYLKRGWLRFFLLQWIFSGLILFVLASKGSIHIGASTWSYAFAGFLSTLAFLHPNRKLLSLFFIICLWYGSMWWGIFPIEPKISFQGHLSGLISGILIGLLGRDYWLEQMDVHPIAESMDSNFNDSPNPNDSLPENPYDKFQ
jgi:membrane associated rhomboid family serine protease